MSTHDLMVTTVSSALTLVFVLVANAVAGQERERPRMEDLREGNRVRVWVPEMGLEAREGRFATWRSDRLRLRLDRQPVLLDLRQLRRLEVSWPTDGDHSGEGALFGGAIGFAAGSLVAGPVACGRAFDLSCDGSDVVVRAGLGGLVVGAVAAGIGALVGSFIPETEWLPVLLPEGIDGNGSISGRLAGLRVGWHLSSHP